MKLPQWMSHWSLNRHLQRAHSTTADLDGEDWQAFITGRSNGDLRLFHLTLHIEGEPGSDDHWHRSYGIPVLQHSDFALPPEQSEPSHSVPDSPRESASPPVVFSPPRRRPLL